MTKRATIDNETVNMYLSQGWNIDEKQETDTYITMKKNTQKFGTHVLLFLVGAWIAGSMMMMNNNEGSPLLAFVGNIIYYAVSNKTKRVMKI
jgi:hypothetical protein